MEFKVTVAPKLVWPSFKQAQGSVEEWALVPAGEWALGLALELDPVSVGELVLAQVLVLAAAGDLVLVKGQALDWESAVREGGQD